MNGLRRFSNVEGKVEKLTVSGLNRTSPSVELPTYPAITPPDNTASGTTMNLTRRRSMCVRKPLCVHAVTIGDRVCAVDSSTTPLSKKSEAGTSPQITAALITAPSGTAESSQKASHTGPRIQTISMAPSNTCWYAGRVNSVCAQSGQRHRVVRTASHLAGAVR